MSTENGQGTFTRELAVKLADVEVRDRAVSGAIALREHEKRNEEFREEKAAKNLELKALLTEARRFARIVEAKEETQSVECRLVFERATARAVTVRIDTGEPIEARVMTAAEVEAVDAGDLEAGKIPKELAAVVDSLVVSVELEQKRAEFNLATWAADVLKPDAIERLVDDGLSEVDAILDVDARELAKVARVSKAKAVEVLALLAQEFSGAAGVQADA